MGLLDRIIGDRDRLGWWTLPVFVAVGLAGAVLAGALTVVWYGQQVQSLRDETRADREELEQAAEEVRRAVDEATGQIDEQVAAVRESLARELPIEDAPARGIVVVRALVREPAATAAAASQEDGSGPTEPPTGGQPEATASPAPSPAPPPSVSPRVGTGFAVAVDGDTVFFATTHGLVRDPGAPGGVAERVEVVTPAGTFSGAVHNWDESRDVALVRADAGGSEIAEWRPRSEELARGERLVAVGVTPTLNTVHVSGAVAYADATVLVTDLAYVDFLRGAPVVDVDGRVVAVFAPDYEPFGPDAGERQAIVPVHVLCERLLNSCEQLEAEPD